MVVFALLVAGRFLVEDLSTVHAALLLSAPLLCWEPELPGLRRLRPWQRGVLRIALVLIPVAFCVTQAKWQAEQREAARMSDYEGL